MHACRSRSEATLVPSRVHRYFIVVRVCDKIIDGW